ncbi:MAG: hypothetical protein ACOZQL_03415 [Myxococcota bacterium]
MPRKSSSCATPVSSSESMTPSAYTSERVVTRPPDNCSGGA